MSNENGRRLLLELLNEHERSAPPEWLRTEDGRSAMLDARALLAAPDGATVRADIAAMLDRRKASNDRVAAETDGKPSHRAYAATASDCAYVWANVIRNGQENSDR